MILSPNIITPVARVGGENLKIFIKEFGFIYKETLKNFVFALLSDYVPSQPKSLNRMREE